MISKDLAAAIQAVVDYSLEDERSDYKENPHDGHIFLSLMRVQEWLDEQYLNMAR